MAVVRTLGVVICFQISIFEPLETTQAGVKPECNVL